VAAERIPRLLADVGLTEAADRMVGTYSSGMKLRLALARALVHRPRVLLLDEPTALLDPVATAHFHDMLRELVARDGVAVLFATHDLHEASAVASDVVILHAGRVAARLSPPLTAEALAEAFTAAGAP
jgi:ABC-2 type transport system ATP-binding protein